MCMTHSYTHTMAYIIHSIASSLRHSHNDMMPCIRNTTRCETTYGHNSIQHAREKHAQHNSADDALLTQWLTHDDVLTLWRVADESEKEEHDTYLATCPITRATLPSDLNALSLHAAVQHLSYLILVRGARHMDVDDPDGINIIHLCGCLLLRPLLLSPAPSPAYVTRIITLFTLCLLAHPHNGCACWVHCGDTCMMDHLLNALMALRDIHESPHQHAHRHVHAALTRFAEWM